MQHTNKHYLIALEYTKNNCYIVSVCPRHSEIFFGYPIREITYTKDEKKKAIATYKRYLKKYL